MIQQDIHKLIERFLNAETTLQEEQMLMEYFRKEDIPEDLQQYREMFLDYGEVASIDQPLHKQPPRIKRIWAVAASIAVLLVVGAGFIYKNNEKTEKKPHIVMVNLEPAVTPEVEETPKAEEQPVVMPVETPKIVAKANTKHVASKVETDITVSELLETIDILSDMGSESTTITADAKGDGFEISSVSADGEIDSYMLRRCANGSLRLTSQIVNF